MMEYLLSSMLVCLLISATNAILLNLKGPNYARKNKDILINCTTDTPSVGLEAEILINSKTYTNMRTYNNECLSAVQRTVCDVDVCMCSQDGYWFAHMYHVNGENDTLKITCVMKFGADGDHKVAAGTEVKIIDFKGPTIALDSDVPLIVGTVASLTCKVWTKLNQVRLKWNCGKESNARQSQASNSYLSTLTFKVRPFHQKTNCTCTGIFEEFQALDSVELEVNSKPILKSVVSSSCNLTVEVQLSCILITELTPYGFNPWTHSFDGTFIRSMNGTVHGKKSILQISCLTYQDDGVYTCSAWNRHTNKVYHSNRRQVLKVNGPPIIVSTNVLRQSLATITVHFFSNSDIERPIWFLMSEAIGNSTDMNATIEGTTISLPVHNRIVICKGYTANLSISIHKDMEYTLLLKNTFGETRKTFELHSDLRVYFDFRMWIFGLSVFGVFLVATTMTVAILRGQQYKSVVLIVGPLERSTNFPIYHSAPGLLDDDHVYERTNHQYLEIIESALDNHYSDIKEEEDDLEIGRIHVDEEDYEEIE